MLPIESAAPERNNSGRFLMGNLINGTAIMITGEIESKNVFFGCGSLSGSKGKRLDGVSETTWKVGNTSYTQ